MMFPLDQSMTFFPFYAEWLSKGRELEIFFKYIEEQLSLSMDVKTDLLCLIQQV
jgi:sporulation-control protein spo0M